MEPGKVFIAGICGVFMAGLAQLARAAGHTVRGCDANVYPPMSDLLRAQGINIADGYRAEHLGDDPGTVLIGNALSRGNPLVEHVLNNDMDFRSGPEWLRAQVLTGRKVIAIAGTHGKTTTASILAWILHRAGQAPGYLIGGKPGNFDRSAELGGGEYFVIEADEYDTAFFDKRAKFVHYRPRIAVLNNLEFDHADIYDDIGQIIRQFHHLVRIVPGDGYVVINGDDAHLYEVIGMGCWSQLVKFSLNDDSAEWFATPVNEDCSTFDVLHNGHVEVQVKWPCAGRHNMQNALAALAAADCAGIPAASAGEFLTGYQPPARRLQLLRRSDEVILYDDFAHHPTAIRGAIEAVRARHPGRRVIAVVELRSNTMKMGIHGKQLASALQEADCAIACKAEDLKQLSQLPVVGQGEILRLNEEHEILAAIRERLSGNDVIITMSNGDFDGLPGRIGEMLAAGAEPESKSKTALS